MTTDSSEFQALFRRGTELLQRGKVKQAKPLLERAHAAKSDHVDAAINLSSAYILTKKFSKAVEILRPLSEENPDHVMIWTNLGAAYLGNPVLARDEDQQRAIAAFKRALSLDPAAPNVAYNLGLIYRDRQEWDTAVYWFKQAVKANPNDDDARRLIKRLRAKQENNGRTTPRDE